MFLVTLLAFGGSLFQNFHQIDDPYLVYNNLATHGVSIENLKTITTTYDPELYIPLTLFSYQIDYMLGGLHPEMYHLTNVLLHAANAVFVAWLLFLLLGRGWVSILCGVLFAIHPLNTEAVVWIAARKDLLSTFFFLATCIAYVLYRRQVQAAYVVSIALFLLALLAKVMVAPLPIILLLIDLLIERRKWSVAMLVDKIPHAVLVAVFMIIAIGGKERVLASSTILQTVLMAGRSTIFYIEKFLMPWNLSVFYPHIGDISPFMLQFFLPALGVCGLLVCAVLAWHRRPLASFGIVFFLLTLTPTFLNFHKGQVMFFAVDRYAYLPSIGLLCLVAFVCGTIGDRWEQRMGSKRAQTIAAQITAVACVALLFLSVRQTGVWNTSETLYAHALSLYPQSVSARTGLAAIYHEQGKIDEEFALLKAGLAYTPNDISIVDSMGSVYAAQGKTTEALALYDQAMRIDPSNPEPYFYRGSLENDRGNVDAAIRDYSRAIELDPSYIAPANNLGSIYIQQGKLDQALAQFEQALTWNANFMEGHYNAGRILHTQGKLLPAEQHLLTANQLNPDSADILTALAAVYVDLQDYNEALAYLKRVLQIDRTHPDAKALLQRLIDSGIVGQQSQRME